MRTVSRRAMVHGSGRRAAMGLGTLAVLVSLTTLASSALCATASPGPVRLAAGADHDCVVPGGPAPSVAWSKLQNPVLSYPDHAAKDQALVWADGHWHMVFSFVSNPSATAGAQRWQIATAESRDLLRWSKPVPWSAQPGGMASPDVVRAPGGTFVATYDSPPGESGGVQAKLFYRTSRDLVHWSVPRPLAPHLYPDPSVRMIDAALAWTSSGLMLGYKVGTTSQAQAFEVARSPSGSLAGPWQIVGRPDIVLYGDTVENYEFLTLGGVWHLVATSNTLDQPWLFTLAGDPSDPASWLHWVGGEQLMVPSESWNTGTGISSVGYEHANSAYLCQDGATYYLTYAGSADLTSFGGWGHAAVGIARSTDLVHWQVPPGPRR